MKDCLVERKSKTRTSLAGQLLIAHPIIEDDELAKTIIFIESNDADGISGFILNQPLNIMLKGLGKSFENMSISNTPVYHGGNVDENYVALMAWAINPAKQTLDIYHDLDDKEAEKLLSVYDNIQFRAFLGHCTFPNTIYDEIERGFWIIGSPQDLIGADKHGDMLWRTVLNKRNPNALLYFN